VPRENRTQARMAATDYLYNGTGNFRNRTGSCEIAALRDATSANLKERSRTLYGTEEPRRISATR